MSKHQIIQNRSGLLTMVAVLSGSLAAGAFAQNQPAPRVAPERSFTIAPNVHTPMVLQTEADAECDLHPAGVSAAARTMRLYANADGYVQVHLTAKPESQDTYLQLDCTTANAVTIHPIHLRTGSSPSQDMPAPQASMPTPTGAQILPALTEEVARQLSDNQVISLGYPPRPDATGAPGAYAAWLDMVSRPLTLLPPHPVNRTDISHQPLGIADTTAETSSNWSGSELRSTDWTYINVAANWIVPPILVGESGNRTYSSLWVGLDGDPNGDGAGNDLVQDGTESDSSDLGDVLTTSYYAWTELVPKQPTAQQQFTINPGDEINASVWVGDSSGNVDLYGGNAWFYIVDVTQHQGSRFDVAFDASTPFHGAEAEWILERPCLSACCPHCTPVFPELSHYAYALIRNATAYDNTTGKWIQPSAANRALTMYESNDPQPDNNVLSSAALVGASSINFTWVNFH